MPRNVDWSRIEKAIDDAIASGWDKESIARDIGTSGNNLRNIINRKASRSQYVQPLLHWLETHVWQADVPERMYAPAAQKETPESLNSGVMMEIIKLLDALNTYLQDESVPLQVRIDGLETNLNVLLRLLPIVRRQS